MESFLGNIPDLILEQRRIEDEREKKEASTKLVKKFEARLARAEGLLKELLSDYDSAPSYLKRYRRVDIYDTQAAEIRAFLHPEQEKPCNS